MASLPEPAAPDPWSGFLARGLLGPERLVANADVELSSVRVGAGDAPLVTNRRGRPDCSWVASLRNAYGPYARAEAARVRMPRSVRPFCLAASRLAEALLAAGGLSGGNYLNNWLLSTNLIAPEFTCAAVLGALDGIVRAEPALPVVIRSLTPSLHADLLAGLVRAGFILLPSRQIWLVPDPASGAWRKHRDARHDLELAAATAARWEWVLAAGFSDGDYARAWHLYQRLYRERYPAFNPDYTEHFLRHGAATQFLELTGLRPAGGGALCGLLGMAHRAGVSCTPLLGYDLDAPPELGLYRLLSLRAWRSAEERRTLLHCSAGAGAFKFSRGAEAHVEFAAVWANHLPLYRRASLRTLGAAVQKWAVPYLEAQRL